MWQGKNRSIYSYNFPPLYEVTLSLYDHKAGFLNERHIASCVCFHKMGREPQCRETINTHQPQGHPPTDAPVGFFSWGRLTSYEACRALIAQLRINFRLSLSLCLSRPVFPPRLWALSIDCTNKFTKILHIKAQTNTL